MKTLRDVPVGGSATIARIHGEGAVKRRIMDMGITRGTEVHVRKVAPLGDPVEITVRGYELSIRKADADNIEIAVPAEETEAAENAGAETAGAAEAGESAPAAAAE